MPKLPLPKCCNCCAGLLEEGNSQSWCCQVCVLIFLHLIFNLISIVEIVLGAIHIDDCPLEPMIPQYLIATGSLSIFFWLFRVLCQASWVNKKMPKWVYGMFIFIAILLFIWFLIGNYYVFHIWEPNYNAELGLYCNKRIYHFAFTMMLIYWTFGLFLLSIPIFLFYGLLVAISERKMGATYLWKKKEHVSDPPPWGVALPPISRGRASIAPSNIPLNTNYSYIEQQRRRKELLEERKNEDLFEEVNKQGAGTPSPHRSPRKSPLSSPEQTDDYVTSEDEAPKAKVKRTKSAIRNDLTKQLRY